MFFLKYIDNINEDVENNNFFNRKVKGSKVPIINKNSTNNKFKKENSKTLIND